MSNEGFVIVNSSGGIPTFISKNDMFTTKLALATIFHDEIYGNSEINRLSREYSNLPEFQKEHLSLTKVTISLNTAI